MATKSFQFLTNTQLEKKGDVSQLDTDSDRCKQLLNKGMIKPYTPVKENKVDAAKETKKQTSKSKKA